MTLAAAEVLAIPVLARDPSNRSAGNLQEILSQEVELVGDDRDGGQEGPGTTSTAYETVDALKVAPGGGDVDEQYRNLKRERRQQHPAKPAEEIRVRLPGGRAANLEPTTHQRSRGGNNVVRLAYTTETAGTSSCEDRDGSDCGGEAGQEALWVEEATGDDAKSPANSSWFSSSAASLNTDDEEGGDREQGDREDSSRRGGVVGGGGGGGYGIGVVSSASFLLSPRRIRRRRKKNKKRRKKKVLLLVAGEGDGESVVVGRAIIRRAETDGISVDSGGGDNNNNNNENKIYIYNGDEETIDPLTSSMMVQVKKKKEEDVEKDLVEEVDLSTLGFDNTFDQDDDEAGKDGEGDDGELTVESLDEFLESGGSPPRRGTEKKEGAAGIAGAAGQVVAKKKKTKKTLRAAAAAKTGALKLTRRLRSVGSSPVQRWLNSTTVNKNRKDVKEKEKIGGGSSSSSNAGNANTKGGVVGGGRLLFGRRRRQEEEGKEGPRSSPAPGPESVSSSASSEEDEYSDDEEEEEEGEFDENKVATLVNPREAKREIQRFVAEIVGDRGGGGGDDDDNAGALREEDLKLLECDEKLNAALKKALLGDGAGSVTSLDGVPLHNSDAGAKGEEKKDDVGSDDVTRKVQTPRDLEKSKPKFHAAPRSTPKILAQKSWESLLDDDADMTGGDLTGMDLQYDDCSLAAMSPVGGDGDDDRESLITMVTLQRQHEKQMKQKERLEMLRMKLPGKRRGQAKDKDGGRLTKKTYAPPVKKKPKSLAEKVEEFFNPTTATAGPSSGAVKTLTGTPKGNKARHLTVSVPRTSKSQLSKSQLSLMSFLSPTSTGISGPNEEHEHGHVVDKNLVDKYAVRAGKKVGKHSAAQAPPHGRHHPQYHPNDDYDKYTIASAVREFPREAYYGLLGACYTCVGEMNGDGKHHRQLVPTPTHRKFNLPSLQSQSLASATYGDYNGYVSSDDGDDNGDDILFIEESGNDLHPQHHHSLDRYASASASDAGTGSPKATTNGDNASTTNTTGETNSVESKVAAETTKSGEKAHSITPRSQKSKQEHQIVEDDDDDDDDASNKLDEASCEVKSPVPVKSTIDRDVHQPSVTTKRQLRIARILFGSGSGGGGGRKQQQASSSSCGSISDSNIVGGSASSAEGIAVPEKKKPSRKLRQPFSFSIPTPRSTSTKNKTPRATSTRSKPSNSFSESSVSQPEQQRRPFFSFSRQSPRLAQFEEAPTLEMEQRVPEEDHDEVEDNCAVEDVNNKDNSLLSNFLLQLDGPQLGMSPAAGIQHRSPLETASRMTENTPLVANLGSRRRQRQLNSARTTATRASEFSNNISPIPTPALVPKPLGVTPPNHHGAGAMIAPPPPPPPPPLPDHQQSIQPALAAAAAADNSRGVPATADGLGTVLSLEQQSISEDGDVGIASIAAESESHTSRNIATYNNDTVIANQDEGGGGGAATDENFSAEEFLVAQIRMQQQRQMMQMQQRRMDLHHQHRRHHTRDPRGLGQYHREQMYFRGIDP